jgi:hypothetical protein
MASDFAFLPRLPPHIIDPKDKPDGNITRQEYVSFPQEELIHGTGLTVVSIQVG